MSAKEIISMILGVGKEVVGDDDFKEFFLGTYADGSPRNVHDALNDEYLSPKQKKKATSKKHKKKKTKFKL